jgi:hypothetical protein
MYDRRIPDGGGVERSRRAAVCTARVLAAPSASAGQAPAFIETGTVDRYMQGSRYDHQARIERTLRVVITTGLGPLKLAQAAYALASLLKGCEPSTAPHTKKQAIVVLKR